MRTAWTDYIDRVASTLDPKGHYPLLRGLLADMADTDAIRGPGEHVPPIGLDREWVNLHMQVARLREEHGLMEHQYNELWETIGDAFNAPDSDTWHPEDSIKDAVAFITAQECTCVPGAHPELLDEDPCPRCTVLGRHHDIPDGR